MGYISDRGTCQRPVTLDASLPAAAQGGGRGTQGSPTHPKAAAQPCSKALRSFLSLGVRGHTDRKPRQLQGSPLAAAPHRPPGCPRQGLAPRLSGAGADRPGTGPAPTSALPSAAAGSARPTARPRAPPPLQRPSARRPPALGTAPAHRASTGAPQLCTLPRAPPPAPSRPGASGETALTAAAGAWGSPLGSPQLAAAAASGNGGRGRASGGGRGLSGNGGGGGAGRGRVGVVLVGAGPTRERLRRDFSGSMAFVGRDLFGDGGRGLWGRGPSGI